MKRKDWPVGKEGIRPNADPTRCMYCGRGIGEQHNRDCGIRMRTVVCRVTIDILRTVPEYWTPDIINFNLNDSSWCADNIIEELSALIDRIACLCPFFEGEYLREATEQDEEDYQLKVMEIPS